MMIYDSIFVSDNILSYVSEWHMISDTRVCYRNIYTLDLISLNLSKQIERTHKTAAHKKIKNKNN